MTDTKLPGKLIPFCWHFVKKRPIAFLVFFLAPLLLILEAIVLPYALKMVVDAFTIYNDNRSVIFEKITPALILGASAWIALIILVRLQELWQVYVMPKVEAEIRMSATSYIMNHSINFFSNRLSGEINNKISDLVRELDYLFMNFRWNIISTFGVIIAFLIVLSTISPLFSLVVLGWVTVDLIISFLFVKYINSASEENANHRSQLSGKIVDTLANITSVKLFSKKIHELVYIKQTQDKEISSNTKVKWRIMIFRFIGEFPIIIMWLIIGNLLISKWQQNQITTGDLVFIFNGILAIMFRMWFLAEALADMFKQVGIVNQALPLLSWPHGIKDIDNAKELSITKGKIEFDNVTFKYKGGEHIFENKSVTINSGEKVGLVGFSGSGKSTFVNIMLRFYDLESGKILIDGEDISQVTQESLRSQIAMIPQDTSLFHRSLMENIRYGRNDASDEEVIEASKKAHCHEFITKLAEGYNTLVGERGIKLSGGQRQRIAIARAILKNAPILILDEATSALDSVTEKQIQESLHDVMENRTTIAIAHRLSTLSEMDRILVFDKGRILEEGSHEELIKANGHYAKIWNMQAGGFLPDDDE